MEIEKLLRIREAILLFFNLHEQDSTPENYKAWLKTLTKSERKKIESLGFGTGRHLISFQSYLLEKKGYLISDFLASYLSEEDYEYFLFISAPLQSEETLVC